MIVSRVRWVAFALSVYLFFNAISYLTLPDYLIATPRNQFVFEHIISQDRVAIIYLIVAICLTIAFSYPKFLVYALSMAALVNVFWGVIAILPALLGVISTGSATGASTLFAFAAVIGISAYVSYRQYNWNPKL